MNLHNFYELLSKRGMKTKIAKETGISTGNLSDYASGRSRPSLENISLIADFFHCSVDYLLGRTETVAVAREPQSPDECKLLERYRSLSEDDRITALGDLIRFASEKAAIKSEAPEDAEAPSGADLVAHWDLLGKR